MGFSPEIIEVLKESLPVYYRKGQGGTFPYVKGEDVIRHLNKAFGHAWSSTVVSHEEVHGQVLVLVSLSVMTPTGAVVHQGFGSSRVAKNSQTNEVLEIGNSYKSAYTAGLKKAAEQFGVGLETEEEDAAPAKPTYSQQTQAAPPRVPYTPKPQVQQAAARPPMQQQAPMQPRPTPAASTPAQPAVAPKPSASSALLSNEKPLSDVQKNALRNLAKVRGLQEDTLVSGALNDGKDRKSEKKSFEELTEKEAVDVIRHANSFTKK